MRKTTLKQMSATERAIWYSEYLQPLEDAVIPNLIPDNYDNKNNH